MAYNGDVEISCRYGPASSQRNGKSRRREGTMYGMTSSKSMKPVKHQWIAGDIVGGNSALDLVNTVSGWGYDPEDWVPEVASFLVWARLSGVLDEGERKQAARLA